MRRGAWLAASLLAGAVGCGLAIWRPACVEAAPMAERVTSVPPVPPAPAPAPTSRPLQRVAAEAGTVVAAPASAVRPDVDVCGYGRVARGELTTREDRPPPPWIAELDRRLQQTQAEVVQRLEGGNLRQRVAAALLREDVQAAALLAAASADPMAYRLALRACRRDEQYHSAYVSLRAAAPASAAASGLVASDMAPPRERATACAALTLERMELLSPDDAWPLFVRLSEARQRRDEVATAQVLYELSQRPLRQHGGRPLSGVLAEVLGAEPSMGEALLLMTAASSDMASYIDGTPTGLLQACRPAQLQDANRRQLCEHVARRLPALTSELLEATMLHVLEQRLSLPHSPQAMSRAELERAQDASGHEAQAWTEEPTCANFALAGRQLAALAREGELAYLRSRLKGRAASQPPP